MSHYQARNLLSKAAIYYQRQRSAISKTEIRKKINEIKYLSAQKKVPKISLRKEIIHLENTLESVFEMEKAMMMQQKRESAKVNALKAEIAALKRLLAVSGDPHLKAKVDHISHVLGEYKAREDIGQDIALSEKVMAGPPLVDEETVRRVHRLEQRLKALKKGLSQADKRTVKLMEEKIGAIEVSLIDFYRQHPELKGKKPGHPALRGPPSKTPGHPPLGKGVPTKTVPHRPPPQKVRLGEGVEGVKGEGPEIVKAPALRKPGVKHTFILGGPEEKKEVILSKAEKVELEKELPLPPPPRMG